ncbi:MAG: 16S rRNA (uracil(1498)-N(3))-methyltransferase [Proteobacteria bacterium]|nr:16S rRNA (uracil(1498)-N(3))-methyltransferase [Pseudomonadota bacterium]MDA0915567.1 16S rRNA (uracil(1498)-N(3))-methyltransferase [Pseudomonadota bacterium]MDA1032802.1 16S rRNA (uracil(1498)-N(3))-methyltransferase [Pseudomonadota bacterium]
MPAKPAWPPRSAPRLFVSDELAAGRIFAIEGQQAHYLGKVMRMREGDAVILCDNITGEWAARVGQVDKRRVDLTVVEKLRAREEVPNFWLCPALLKKDRFDLVLEKATELGVAEIRPVLMRRCVADKLNLERANTITTEAAEQCARTALPKLRKPAKLEALLRDWPEDRILYFADELGGEPASIAFGARSGPDAMLIGPEGGFDDAEREMLRSHPQVKPISLGPRILRGETAAIAATALWMGNKGDWNN